MSLTEKGWDRIIKGKFPDGFVRGRIAIGLERIQGNNQAEIKIMILDLEENIVLFEYDEPLIIKRDAQLVLTDAEIKTAIQVVEETKEE